MQRSKHSLSHYRLTSLNQGQLYPVALEEVLPGDSFRHQTSVLLRVSPLVSPVMHPVHLSVHHWYVPTRLLWDKWEKFITGTDPNLVVPTVQFSSAQPEITKLAQSFGAGYEGPAAVTLSALPFRAYNLIWNEFYRDQDLNAELPFRIGDTGDLPADYKIQNVSWEKDYFTTARPYPQQGANTEVVALALTGKLPVHGIGTQTTGAFATTNLTAREGASAATKTYAKSNSFTSAGGLQMYVEEDPAKAGWPNTHVNLADLAGGTVNMDINEWRRSMAMQRMREHRNRFGSRYRDMLAFLGVNSSDSRLQRPEYLGGGKQTISFSEVLSTAETTDGTLGDMGGHGIAALRTRPYKRFFEEHGYMFSFLSVRPRSVYMNRVPRHFMRRDYEQYWQKELEMMGEQPITNFEIFGDASNPGGTFGYIPRYDEYRHAESFVSGEFRTILDYWHMARKFTGQPALNGTFVSCDPTNRIYAATENDQLYAMISHRISARRLVSKKARTM